MPSSFDDPEPPQRCRQVALQIGIRPLDRSLSRHDDQIGARGVGAFQHLVDRGTQAAAGAIALDRVADLLGRGEADTHSNSIGHEIRARWIAIMWVMGMRFGLENQTGRRPPSICRGDGEKFAALFEAIESSGQVDSP